MAQDAALSGTLLWRDGTPIGDSTVKVSTDAGSVTTQTDAAGQFSMASPAGEAKLQLALPLNGGTVRVYSAPFNVQGATDLGTVWAPPLKTFTVKVVDANGLPLQGAQVTSGGSGGGTWLDSGLPMFGSTTGADNGVWNENFRLTTGADGLAKVRMPRTYVPTLTVSYRHPATGITYTHQTSSLLLKDDATDTWQLPAIGEVSGTLLWRDGTPIGDSTVKVSTDAGSVTTQTDAAGQFSMASPAGEAKLQLALPLNGGTVRVYSAPFNVQGATDLGTVWAPPLKTFTVKVVDANGLPLQGAQVTSGGSGGGTWLDSGLPMFGSTTGADNGVWNENFRLTTGADGLAKVRMPRTYVPTLTVSYRHPATGITYTHQTSSLLLKDDATDTWQLPVAAGAPDAPAKPTAVRGDAQATVTWTKPANNGSQITSYTVTSTPGGKTAVVDGDTTTAILDGLTNGTTYTFSVVATNAIGDSTASEPSNQVTPEGAPAAPTAVTARAGVNSARVAWDHVYEGSSSLSFTVTASPGGQTCTTASHACTVPGLTNGRAYTFTVIAHNGAGDSLASDPSNEVTPSTDTAPPRLASTSVTPDRVSSLGGAVTVEAKVTDDLSGFDGQLYVIFNEHGGDGSFGFTRVPRVSGDEYDGTYRTSIQVPSGSAPGQWNLTVYPLDDKAGNGTFFTDHSGIVVGTPAAPQTPNAETRAGRTVHLSWAEPADDGGNLITGYQVQTAPSGEITSTDQTDLDLAFPNRSPEDPVRFRVRAINAGGPSSWSDYTDDITIPAEAPTTPTDVTATASGRSATVTWSKAAGNGSPVTGYTVTSTPGDKRVTVDGETTTATVDGLTNGTAYTFTVTATNTVGDSTASDPSNSVTPAVVPTAPTDAQAVPGDGSAEVSWAKTAGNGSPVTGYTVTSTPGGKSVTVDGETTTATVDGLTNGTAYTFTVTATNTVGDSTASDPSNSVTPAGVPTAPTDAQAVRGDGSAEVSWAKAAGNGTPVTGYTVTSTPGDKRVTVDGETTTATVDGLTNGTAYTFTVTATNTVGDSTASDPSNSVTPMDVTDPEVRLEATPEALSDQTAATFAFTASDNNAVVLVECQLDNQTFEECASPLNLDGFADGQHSLTVRVSDQGGNSSTATHAWTVDATSPTAEVTRPGHRTLTLRNRVPVAWAGTDTGSGLADFDVKWLRIAPNGTRGRWRRPSGWTGTSSTRARSPRLAAGSTYCFAARAHDAAGNVSRWSRPSCVAAPLDDRALRASAGWTRGTGARFYKSTHTSAHKRGAVLRKPNVRATQLGVVATVCPRCGRIGVYDDGRLIRRIDLSASKARNRRLILLPRTRVARTGVITIKTLSARKLVRIDGLAIHQR